MMRLYCSAILVLLLCGSMLADEVDCKTEDEHLPSMQQELLREYGVVFYRGELFVSARLASGCGDRASVSRFLTDTIIRGAASEEGRKFGGTHSELVSSVVKQVWPLIAASRAVPSDGTLRHDKWNMLLEPSVNDSTVTALVSEFIKKSGMSADAAYLLLHRSLPELNPVAKVIMVSKASTISERLFAIAVLSRNKDASIASYLRRLAHNGTLTQSQSTTVKNLQVRLSTGQPARWEDVQSLVEGDL